MLHPTESRRLRIDTRGLTKGLGLREWYNLQLFRLCLEGVSIATSSLPSNFCPACGGRLALSYVEDEERERLVCGECGHIYYINPKIVAGTIPEVDGKVWLLRRAIEPRRGFWTFPAGFMEMGETVVEAAVRETREELNLEVELGTLLGVYSLPHMSTVHIIYLAKALSEPTGGKETLEFARFHPDDIPWTDLAFWTTRKALEDWVQQTSV